MKTQVYSYAAGTVPETLRWQVRDKDTDQPIDFDDEDFPVDTVEFVYTLRRAGVYGEQKVKEGVKQSGGEMDWTPDLDDFAEDGVIEGTAYYLSGGERREGALVFIDVFVPPGGIVVEAS